MTTPSGFPRDIKNYSSTSSFPFERDRKGEASFPREHKRAFSEEAPPSSCSSSSSWQRESKGGLSIPTRTYSLVDSTAKRSKLEKHPLSLVDQRLIAATREKHSLATSEELKSLDTRIAQAITRKGIQISYPVHEGMVSEDLLSFCDTFFFSFSAPQDRDVHNYFMGRIIDLTFCSPEVTPDPSFLQTFSEKIAEKVHRYTDTRIAKLRKEVVEQEGGYGRRKLGDVRQEIRSLAERIDSFRKELFPTDTRPILCEQNIALLKQALLITEEQQYKEQYHAHALPGCQTKEEELPHILALGDLYLERAVKEREQQTAIQAAGLYNYALRLAGKSANKYKLFHKLHATERQLFALCTSNQAAPYQSVRAFYDTLKNNRELLKKHRNTSEALVNGLTSNASPEEVRDVCRTITDTMKGFTRTLLKQCLEQLGTPPCNYAIIGFGSLAREEMTPRSDLEFAILLENEEYRPYFRKLSYLLHFQVVNLGETILPCLNIPSLREAGFYDGHTPRGFSFDGEGGGVNALGIATKGCKTPFGNRDSFHLIHTPEQMAAFQGMDLEGQYWVEKEPHLPMELIAHTLIMGSEELVEEYRAVLDKELARSYKKGTMRSYLAKEHLYEGDDDRFDPSLHNTEKEGQLFEVKNDLYRLPHLLIDRLACFFRLNSLNTVDRVNELQEKGIFRPGAAKNVRDLVATTTKLRLHTYQFHRKQKGLMNAVARQLGFVEEEGQFVLDKRTFYDLQQVYQVLLPFHKAVHQFFRADLQTFQTVSFWDDTPFTLGKIAARLLCYSQAKRYYEAVKKREPGNIFVLNSLGMLQHQSGELRPALHNLEAALAVAKNNRGEWHPDVAILLNNLALLQKEMGVSGYVGTLEQALEIDKAVYGEQHPMTALHLSSLAIAHQEKGDLQQALSLFERVWSISKVVHERKHPSIIRNLNNLASVYKQVGELSKALSFFEDALEIAKEVYGTQHPATASLLNNLASVYREQGKMQLALSLFQQALEINNVVYGEEHPKVAIGLHNVGSVYMEMGKYTKAFCLIERAVKVNEKIYGEEHPVVATHLCRLAEIYQKKRDLERAFICAKKAWHITEAIYGKEHFNTVLPLSRIGALYYERREVDQACSFFEQALRITKKAFGYQHSTVATHLNNLALAYQEKGEDSRARSLFKKAVEIDRKLYGWKHPSIARDLNNLALAYQKVGDTDRAVSFLKQALAITKEVYGEQHPIVAIHLNNLALACKKKGDLEGACSFGKKALDITRVVYGKRHPAVAIRLNNLALLLFEKGEIQRVLPLLQRAIQMTATRKKDPRIAVFEENARLFKRFFRKNRRNACWQKRTWSRMGLAATLTTTVV